MISRYLIAFMFTLTALGCGDDSNPATSTGGVTTTGGATGTGGDQQTGGMGGTGGNTQTGGLSTTGGVNSTGGDNTAGTDLVFGDMLGDVMFSDTEANIVEAISTDVPTCADGEFACNGNCLSDDASAIGQAMNGCTLLATGSNALQGLVLVNDSLFYASAFDEVVYKLPITGGMPTAIASNINATVLHAYNDQLVIGKEGCDSSFDTCLVTLPQAGGSTTPLFDDLRDVTDSFGSSPASLSFVDDVAYYLSPTSAGTDRVFYRRSMPSGQPEALFSAQNLKTVATDGAWAFAEGGLGTDNYIVVTPLDRSEAALVLSTVSYSYRFGFFHDGYCFLSGNDNSAEHSGKASYQRLNLTTKAVELLRTLPISSGGPMLLGSNVYFWSGVGTSSSDRGLYKMPIDGGDATLVASFANSDLNDYVLSDGALYGTLALGGNAVVIRVDLP